ncbi:MAG: ABC transporter substrate-binding protein [Armatimonadetes bacterium]|nr:ABC transporter substrate-binding protein [Candidatus Hippobium faecium]
MRKIFLILLCILCFCGCEHKSFFIEDEPKTGEIRAVSLAPSITDMIIALDGGECLVGVTKFCKNPDKKWTEIGGYMDFSKETFVSLKPNMVFLAPYHTDAKEICDEMGIEYTELDLSSFDSIRTNIMTIGRKIGKTDKACELINKFNSEMQSLSPSKKYPKVLIVLDRNYGTEDIGKVYAVGDGGIFARPINLAGGINVYEGFEETPVLTAEGIVSLNPDVIVDVAREGLPENISRDWEKLNIKAVKNHNLFVLDGKDASVPNEKFYETVKKLAEIFSSAKM